MRQVWRGLALWARVGALAGAGIVLLAAVAALVFLSVYRPWVPGAQARSRVVVPAGMSARAVGEALQAAGAIRAAFVFRLLVRVEGAGPRLEAGTYRFGPGMSPVQILNALVHGSVAVVRVTVPEGFTAGEVVAALGAHGIGGHAALEAAVDAASVLRAAGLPQPPTDVRHALEGYLFPATYTFPLGASPRQDVARMVARFRQAWTPTLAAAAARGAHLDTRQAVTLASIVQSEVRGPRAMAIVAGVYLNRLRRQMDLDADPTVLYGLGLLGQQTHGLTLPQLRAASPYNTYLHPGLPPGPICNPGLMALRAVAYPAHVQALYFLTTPSDRLVLADTLSEQQANARRYGVG